MSVILEDDERTPREPETQSAAGEDGMANKLSCFKIII